MTSPSLLTAYEKCPRSAFWSRDWQRAKIDLTELLQEGIKEGVRTSREDYGNASGEKVMEKITHAGKGENRMGKDVGD